MNKIIIDKNRIDECNSKDIKISNDVIEFKKNGEYYLDIVSSDKLDVKIVIKDNACVKLFMFSESDKLKGHIRYELGIRSNLILFKFYSNKEVELEENIYLNGEYAKISYNFSSICCGLENYKIRVFHNNNYVDSYVSNKCIGNDGSKIKFLIDSILDKGNVGCSMDQDTKIICMGEVEASIKPNMYIEEDDVTARHGSVIGKFNDEDVFYLMSRGINEKEAIKLMIKGFILSNLVIDMDSRSRILAIINNMYK